MPYDFIKASLSDKDIGALLDNPVLDFRGNFSRSTGEVLEYPITANYGALKIKVLGTNYGEISGSIHKHFSSGTNYSDFTLNNFIEVVQEDLVGDLGIDIDKSVVKNLEVGLNINTGNRDPFLIASSAYLYKNKFFSSMESLSGYCLGRNVKFSQYRVKLYSKERQYKHQARSILRYEHHWMKNEKVSYISQIDRPVVFADLMDMKVTDRLYDHVKRSLRNVVFIPADIHSRVPESKLVENWTRDVYVQDIFLNNEQRFRRERNTFKEMVFKGSI